MILSRFDRDDGNRSKCLKHGVSAKDIESLFLGPIMILPDEAHSVAEARVKAVGEIAAGRHIFLVFTIREKKRQAVHPAHQRPVHAQEGSSAP